MSATDMDPHFGRTKCPKQYKYKGYLSLDES